MKTSKTAFLSVLVVPVLVARLAMAAVPQFTADFDHATGTTTFLAKGHPSAMHINGKGDAPTGKLDVKDGKVSGVLALNLESLDTGIGMRTHHMKEKYLEVGKFPQAKLTLNNLPLAAADTTAKDFSLDKVPFTGILSLHGVNKPVSGLARIERKGANLHLNAEFPLKISDYGIEIPSFAGITVADEVDVVIQSDTPLIQAAK